MSKIDCCNGCVPPERTPTCHSTCKQYKEQRAALDAENAEINKQKALNHGLDCSKIHGIETVRKENRRGKRKND